MRSDNEMKPERVDLPTGGLPGRQYCGFLSSEFPHSGKFPHSSGLHLNGRFPLSSGFPLNHGFPLSSGLLNHTALTALLVQSMPILPGQ